MSKIRFPVEATHIMMYARALGETNPVYFDQEEASKKEVGGVIAPPTFGIAVAQFDPEYPLRPKPGEAWIGSGKTPSGRESKPTGGAALHAEEEYTYHRPLRPGDVLTCEKRDGLTWSKQRKRGGEMTFQERISEFRNEQGELVLSARTVIVRLDQRADTSV